MNNSNFRNPTGLTEPGQYSTAYDMALAGRAAASTRSISNITILGQIEFRMANGETRTIFNTNKVLRLTPYCTGLKTGYTEASGRCLISCGERGLQKVIVVVLGSDVPEIWTDSHALLHWGLGLPIAES